MLTPSTKKKKLNLNPFLSLFLLYCTVQIAKKKEHIKHMREFTLVPGPKNVTKNIFKSCNIAILLKLC